MAGAGNTSLSKLRLTDNLISETGGMLLADMLESHGSLHSLDVRANQVRWPRSAWPRRGLSYRTLGAVHAHGGSSC